ncbi:threonine dehydratase [Acidovorax temperans]|uniref:Threonine dehydratase n=1 Tax=Acidovorax temperans TaxID=80878 RepID=A0A543L134_9BURK|nr:threo-3-hydroxy-L-aspartate ammonia-lyase [Acidovorax temperans]TQN01031.1 threonine dehydratase [Acidovorax temperans]
MNPAALPAPTFDDLRAAAQRLHGIAHRTPVLRSTSADESTGAQVFFKCENLQRTGAFKFRGAYNTLAQFTPEQRERGVLAFSAGNHAQAIALSARLLDMPAVIVMPEDAPATKMAATREYGAQVVTYNRYTEDREAISRRLAQERGMTLVPPFDHPHVIAGQGTAAMELLEDVPGLDYLFVCVGGGGLLAGSTLAAQVMAPGCRLVGVEPEAGNDGQQSFKAGHIVQIPTPHTIADGAQTQALGQLTFPIIAEGVEDMVTATDEQLVQALRFFAERMKIVVEPTGALAFAGVRNGSVDVRGKRVGVLISGGNVDLPRYARFLAE